MFNLEEQILEWRRQMLASGIKAPAPLNELEAHLREDVRALVSAGTPEEEAFQLATSRMGNPGALRSEFNKIEGSSRLPLKIGLLVWGCSMIPLVVSYKNLLFSGRLRYILLSVHTLSLTAGYFAAFLAGAFGIYHICWGRFRELSLTRQQSLFDAVVWFNQISAGLVVVGLMLGMIWERRQMGTYWSGGIREIAIFCASAWLTGVLAIQRLGKVSDRAMMLMCVGGNMIVSLAWFGAGILASRPGIHGYGMGTWWPLPVFLGINLCVLVMGMTPATKATET